jgi:hypothetical protein
MIDTIVEEVRPLAQAAKWVPRRRGDRPTHVTTLYRWKAEGLETIRVGGSVCTSREALQRFYERQTQASNSNGPAAPRRSVGKRQRQSEAAGRELERLGA